MHTQGIIELACKAGKIVLENGGEIYRVEQTMTAICAAYGMDGCECFATPTIIMISAPGIEGTPCSRMMRITARGINLDKITAVNEFSRKLPVSLNDAMTALKNIDRTGPYPLWIQVLASGAGIGVFTYIFGGSIGDFVSGIAVGALLRIIVALLHRKNAGDFMVNLLGGVSAALGGWLLYLVNLASDQWIVTVSSIMLLVPGLLFTNALRDIAAGDLVSGVSRCMEALSIAAALACGAAAVFAVAALTGGGMS